MKTCQRCGKETITSKDWWKNMTIGGQKDTEGRDCYTLELDYASTEAFKQGKPIVKHSADSQGHFIVVTQLKRPRRKADRFKGL